MQSATESEGEGTQFSIDTGDLGLGSPCWYYNDIMASWGRAEVVLITFTETSMIYRPVDCRLLAGASLETN